ncbi:MAG: hypothetical protein ACKPKO_59300, partial [Candidatus Fonsibacter sp.]
QQYELMFLFSCFDDCSILFVCLFFSFPPNIIQLEVIRTETYFLTGKRYQSEYVTRDTEQHRKY